MKHNLHKIPRKNLRWLLSVILSLSMIFALGVEPALATTSNAVVIWGDNSGNNTAGQTYVPSGLSVIVTDIAAGGYHGLALKSDGTVAAWGGLNNYGETDVPAGLTDVTAIAAGYDHSLALKSDGTLVAWGSNFYGETDVPAGLTDVTAIAAGFGFNLVLKSDGTLAAWGHNNWGQVDVPAGLTDVTAIAAGDSYSLALKSDGTLVAWGSNNQGESTVPSGLTDVTAIAAGGYHSLALKSDGTVVAWGDNGYGESDVPTGLTDVIAIAAGYTNSLALKSDGMVVAWGGDYHGESTVPSGLTDVTAIAAGFGFSMAIVSPFQQQCVPGMYDNGSGCVNADPGFYVDTYEATSETPCDAGYYQPDYGSDSCIPANPGHYVAIMGSVAETACAPGSYQPYSGQISCLLADPGSYVDTAGAVSESACPEGYTSEAGATECTPLNNPVPSLSNLNPMSAQVSASELSFSVYGSSFVDGAEVRWLDSATNNTTNLATTFVSSSELSAVVPSVLLTSPGTFEVSVFNPAPGGGTSSPLTFFVTQSGAAVTNTSSSTSTSSSGTAAASTGGSGAGTPGSISVTATGSGTISVAQYDSNPIGTAFFTAVGAYFDVYIAQGSDFSSMTLVACNLTGNAKIRWWNGSSWIQVDPQSFNNGCITMNLSDTSTPTISQLTGTIFAVANLPPAADVGGPYISAVNTAIQFDGSGSSDPEDDTLAYAWDFSNGGISTGVMPAYLYTSPGIYNVCLTVNDGWRDSEPNCTLAVVYDPDGGFVTGGGWIDSPAGAYTADLSLTGKATFGFVSKYKKGASVPTGNTEFQFQAGGFNFHSDTYEWLVVNQNGANAQFKGSGSVNGALDPNGNAYKFMLWAGDGSPDTFRIKIWYEDETGGHVVYDNGFDQAISGGSIVVHKK